jgi:hypothetical protein
MVKGNPRGSGYEKATNNFYQEGPRAIEALLDAEPFEGTVWDPACGEGNIPKACIARGFTTYATDLVDRGYGGGGLDFLTVHTEAGPLADNILVNPPFDLIELFIHQALRLTTRKVAVIGRLAFLEGSKRRETLFTRTPIARVWVFSSRISMPPGGQEIEPKGGSIPFAWYVWTIGHEGPPTIGWLP